MNDDERTLKSGLWFALGAYLMWGFFPLYWKLLLHVPSMEILAHRMVWSLGFMVLLLGVQRRWTWLRYLDLRTVGTYLVAALFLSLNWGLYIWAVNAGFIVATALGYFINPLINVVFGTVFLGERPRRGQWVAIGLAAMGVLHLTLVYGQLPLIALALGTSFAIYGLIKKKAPLGALEGVTLESALVFLPALGFIFFLEGTEQGNFLAATPMTLGLLLFSGVATMLPLLCFAAAVRRISLTVLGLMQYLAPTIQFLIGVLVFHEELTMSRFIGFLFIWAGLIVFSTEGILARRRRLRTPGPQIGGA